MLKQGNKYPEISIKLIYGLICERHIPVNDKYWCFIFLKKRKMKEVVYNICKDMLLEVGKYFMKTLFVWIL